MEVVEVETVEPWRVEEEEEEDRQYGFWNVTSLPSLVQFRYL